MNKTTKEDTNMAMFPRPNLLGSSQVNLLVRDAAMDYWSSGSYENFRDVRLSIDGWTNNDVDEFLGGNKTTINKMHGDLERWIGGEAEIR